MNKKRITVFVLSFLILGQGLATSVQAKESSSNYIVQGSSIKDNGEFEYNEDFSVGTKGRLTYTYDYTATASKVNMKISFNKRARNFKVVLKNSSGRMIASKSFVDWEAPDGSKGVKRVQLRGNTTIGENYTIEMINYDSVIIDGTINVKG